MAALAAVEDPLSVMSGLRRCQSTISLVSKVLVSTV